MSDDLFESFGDEDLFLDEEEEELSGEAEGEGQNRTFIIAVAVLGGLLVCALAAFGVWAFVISPRQARNQASEALPSPTVTVEAEETIEATPTEEIPTDTPEPEPTNTPTPVVGPTRTPTPEVTATVEGTPEEGETEGAGAEIPGEGADEGVGEDEDVTPTPRPRRTATPRPTPTTRSEPAAGDATGLDEDEELSQTGLGEWLLAGAALLLFGVAILARRLRST